MRKPPQIFLPPEPVEIGSTERNPYGWIALAFILVCVIILAVGGSLFPDSTTQFFSYDQKLGEIVRAEKIKHSPIGKLAQVGDSTDAEDLLTLERQVAKVRSKQKIGSVLYAAILTEEHKPVPAWDIDQLAHGKQPGTRAMGEIYASKTLTRAKALELSSKLAANGYFVTDLAKVHALEKAGDKTARTKLIKGPESTALTLLSLGAVGLFFGCFACWLGYAAIRAAGELPPKGLLNGGISLQLADRFAVRAAQLIVLFMGADLVVQFFLRKLSSPMQSILSGAITLIGLALLSRLKVHGDLLSLKRLGLTTENLAVNVLWGIGGFVAELPIAMVLAAIAAWVFKFLPTPEHPASMELTLNHDPFTIISLLFAGTIVAPIWEEVMFRGLLFPALSRVLKSVPIGAVASSVIFASVHPQGISIWASLATTGLMSCALTYQTRSLIPSIVMHFCHNLVLMVLTVVLS